MANSFVRVLARAVNDSNFVPSVPFCLVNAKHQTSGSEFELFY